MQDRQYQIIQIEQVLQELKKHQCVLNQLPTGGGKTVEFSILIKQFINQMTDLEKGPCLILVNRIELLRQTEKAIKEVLGFDPCLITSDTDRFWLSRCYIGMVESTLKRLHMIVNPSLIIIDEAHVDNFKKVHAQFPTTKIIGFTATPISASKKDPLKNYYQEIVVGPQIKELINMGYLSQNITRSPSGSIDPKDFQVDKLKGEYNELQMSGVYRMTNNISNVIDKYFEYCLGKKTLIFNVNIQHSKEVTDCFNACGYPAKHLDASCKDRDEIMHWFKITPGAILNSVMIPTVGFDEPTVQSCILNFSTLSLTKFIQTCGRGSRIIDEYFIEKFHQDYPYELTLKNSFDIIDLGQNWKRFGDWNDDRDWRWIFKHPDIPNGDGISPIKSCPKCEGLVHAAVRVCPLTMASGELCLHEFQKRQFKQMDMEEMTLITQGIDVNALVENSEKKYKYYPMFALAIDVVDNMFLIHGNNPSRNIVEKFFRTYYQLCIGWYKGAFGNKEDMIDDISDSGWHIKKARNNFNSLIQKKNKQAVQIVEEIPYKLVHIDEDIVRKKEDYWNQHKTI